VPLYGPHTDQSGPSGAALFHRSRRKMNAFWAESVSRASTKLALVVGILLGVTLVAVARVLSSLPRSVSHGHGVSMSTIPHIRQTGAAGNGCSFAACHGLDGAAGK
jgi:hypothetical protein